MKDFTSEGIALVDQATALVIKNKSDYDSADALGKVAQERIKAIKDYFKPMKADAKKAHQNIVNAEKFSLEDYEKAKAIIKQDMLMYEVEQEKLRKAEEEKLKIEFGDKAEFIAIPKFETKGQTRDNYKYKVENWDVFVKWCFENKKLNYLEPNDAELKAYAKGKVSEIPGILVYNDPIKVL